ncbi:MAG: nuclear transport factor 2 family protein [Anaerolineaceae bacterium]|nr:nuclear transport factor 2 family protein [Anaerolineaceae bacterium]MBN2678259.1 nuclear transport factor 2 family protein [Anaerolineaceae bacterium]
MALTGKGSWIWKIKSCEAGNATAIANAATSASFTHVPIKIADGPYQYNYDRIAKVDLISPVREALRIRGILVWGWHYVYGYDPIGEANIAIQQIQRLGLDGYIIDAEHEYKEPGKATAATRFMNALRAALPNLPIALSSYRFPTLHMAMPWTEFLNKCDYNMPQVYWELAHNPVTQLTRCVNEFKAITPYRPIIPTGPTYSTGDWQPNDYDIQRFLDTAKNLGLTGANFFSWDECRASTPSLWNIISKYAWGAPPLTIINYYINALNTNKVDQILALYNPNAAHITAARTIQGTEALRTWYNQLFNSIMPNATYTLTGIGGSGNTRSLTWNAISGSNVFNGSDTLGIQEDRIIYHFSALKKV